MGLGVGTCASCGGRGFAGALPAGVRTCWCAASAFAGGGPREGLDRQRAEGRFRVAGSGLGSRVTHDSSFSRSWATDLRSRVLSVDLQPQERSCGWRSTDGGRRAGRILPSRGTVHSKEESFVTPTQSAPTILHSRVRGLTLLRSRRDPVGNAESLPSRTRTQNLASTPAPAHSPRPRTSSDASRPVEALSETRHSEGRGSAPVGRDALRQRSSKHKPPAAAQQQGHDHRRQRTSTTHLHPLPHRAWWRCVGR